MWLIDQLYIKLGYNFFLAGWSGAEIKGTVHVALPKQPINKYKPVQQSKYVPRAYCPNVYTVMRTPGNVHYDRRGRGMNKVKKKHTKCLIFPEKSIVPFFWSKQNKGIQLEHSFCDIQYLVI